MSYSSLAGTVPIVILLLLMLFTVTIPIIPGILFLMHAVGAAVFAHRDSQRAQWWVVAYLLAVLLFVVLHLWLIPVVPRAWTASLSGIGSGVLSPWESRMERFYAGQACFQAAASCLLVGYAPEERGRLHWAAVVVGALLLVGAIATSWINT